MDKLDVMSEDLTPEGASDNLKAAIKLTQIFLGEGIGLFGAFATLLNMKRSGVLNGFNDVNEWSLKDEQEHVSKNIEVVREMEEDLTEVEKLVLREVTFTLVENFEKTEDKYIDLVYDMGGAEGLSAEDMKGYIKYLGKLRLFQRGYVTLRDVPKNPLEWMEWLLGANKHKNFFESKVVDYVHKELSGEVNYNRYRHILEKN